MKHLIPYAVILCMLLLCTACGAPAKDTTTTTATTVKTTAPVPTSATITADSLRVYGGAGLSHEIIGGLKRGDTVTIVGRSGDWYAISFGDTTGYVTGQYLDF